MNITLKSLTTDELVTFWQLAFSNPNAEWTKWNGPYFNDQLPSQSTFINTIGPEQYVHNPFREVIYVDQRMVGLVTAHYADYPLSRWLEVGIVIYQTDNWQLGIGQQALRNWITKLWTITDLPHIGLTTWSGNQRMCHLAERIGLQKEGQIRQVRYWQNEYWDSVKYGVLRSEWQSTN